MEIVELVRRWQAGETERAIARQTGIARATVKQYRVAARVVGVERSGPPPTEGQPGRLGQRRRVVGVARPRAAPERERLAAERERIAQRLRYDRRQLPRAPELLAQDGVRVSASRLRRCVQSVGLGRPPRTGSTAPWIASRRRPQGGRAPINW